MQLTQFIKYCDALLDFKCPGISVEGVLEFENKFAFQLPSDFRAFITHINGGALGDMNIGFTISGFWAKKGEKCQYYVY